MPEPKVDGDGGGEGPPVGARRRDLMPRRDREGCAGYNGDMNTRLNRGEMLDLYFLEARCKLIEIAAFLDRLDRAPGEADYRLAGLRGAMRHLADGETGRAERVLLALSDPTAEPIAVAPGKGASGAWPGPTAG